jgi:hypothetical protein
MLKNFPLISQSHQSQRRYRYKWRGEKQKYQLLEGISRYKLLQCNSIQFWKAIKTDGFGLLAYFVTMSVIDSTVTFLRPWLIITGFGLDDPLQSLVITIHHNKLLPRTRPILSGLRLAPFWSDLPPFCSLYIFCYELRLAPLWVWVLYYELRSVDQSVLE